MNRKNGSVVDKKKCQNCSPWVHFIAGSQLLRRKCIVKSRFDEDGYEVCITDLEILWHEEMHGNDLQDRMKSLNPNIEAPVSGLLQHLEGKVIKHCKDATYEVLISDEHLKFTLDCPLSGLPFKWEFYCRPKQSLLCTELTRPVMSMVAVLLLERQKLIEQIKQRDEELSDIRRDGAKSHKSVQIPLFTENAFNRDVRESKVFSASVQNPVDAFQGYGAQLYADVMLQVDDAATTELIVAGRSENVPTGVQSRNPVIDSNVTVPQSEANQLPSSTEESNEEAERRRRKALDDKLENEKAKLEAKKKRKQITL